MKQPTVSIITPVYNGAQTLQDCFSSVVNQSYPHFEWILVDDASTDASREIIQNWRDPRITLIQRKSNAGQPALPRKEACNTAKGKYLALLDQDDKWTPDKLSFQIDILEKRPDIALLGGNQIVIGPKAHKRTGTTIIRQKSFSPDAQYIYRHNPFLASTMIFKKDAYEKVSGFDTKDILVGRDEWELWIRIALQFKTYFHEIPVGEYRWHENNLSHKIDAFEGLDYVRNKLGPHFPKQFQNSILARDHYIKAKAHLKAKLINEFKLEIKKATDLKMKYFWKGIFLRLQAFF